MRSTFSGIMTPSSGVWSLFEASQNLAAVLNDPTRTKQTNFFVKDWGEAFIEKEVIGRSPFLPDVTYGHFAAYMKRIGKRLRKRHTINAKTDTVHNSDVQTGPSSGQHHEPKNTAGHRHIETIIPEIFLRADFPLNQPSVFEAVFQRASSTSANVQNELSHHLDIVEECIARQVSAKSESLFHAMTSHDAIVEQMASGQTAVRQLQKHVNRVDHSIANVSLRLLALHRSKRNHSNLVNKLKLMATVLQTQPTLQILLSSSDYVSAMELISSTQDVLGKELAGISSVRHLPSQLKEMSKLIEKMLGTEFERYAAADLHRPLNGVGILDQERLTSMVAGLLRQSHLHFLETYKNEALMAVQMFLKQLLIEQLVDADNDEVEHSSLRGTDEIESTIGADNWLRVLQFASQAFRKLIERVKAVHDIVQLTASESAGLRAAAVDGEHRVVQRVSDSFLSLEEYNRVELKLKGLLHSICECCMERLATIVNRQTEKHQKTTLQIDQLSVIVEEFTRFCEGVCDRQFAVLRAAFKVYATNYIHKFHTVRKTKLTLLLEAESWRCADVPHEIQLLVDRFGSPDGDLRAIFDCCWVDGSNGQSEPNSDVVGKAVTPPSPPPPSPPTVVPTITVSGESYATVGTVLILVRLIVEYCVCANNLRLLASAIARNLTELLHTFNSRCCQLVLGAGALKTAGLKTITITNLVLTSRSLQLVQWMLRYIHQHFASFNSDSIVIFDSIGKNITDHIHQLESKVLNIMEVVLKQQLNEWDAKPPVPSKAFRNITRQLNKFYDAINSVLPRSQILDLYETIHETFKNQLRQRLITLNIQNNGGPQHGLVTSEIIFYLETMRKLNVLAEKQLADINMSDIWLR